MGKHILVVVDYQYDFYSPEGALYVKGGENLQTNIAGIIPDFDHTIFTQDWHPASHCSFDSNGGQWPVHCVENTLGAEIPAELLALCKSYTLLKKGCNQNKEEYGAFADSKRAESLLADAESVVVCGIAGDYCVLETLKNIVGTIGTDRVRVYLDGTASIDNGTALNSYMKEKNILATTKYEEAIKLLKDSPMFNLSLSSKELFHSNFLYWIYLANKKAFRNLLNKIEIDTGSWGENWVAKREYLNFDLCIISNDEKQERLLAVIENKVKSIPTVEQLAKYNDKIIKKFGKETKPQRILLSLTESNIKKDDLNGLAGWRYVSYQSICDGLLEECFQSNFSGYSKELINDYANFVQALITLANIWKEDVVDNNIFLLDYNDRESKNEGENQEDVVSNNGQSNNISNKYSDAKELRIHDLYGKYRTAILKEKLEDRLKDKGLLEHPTLSITPQIAYSNSQPILEVMIKGIVESEDDLDAEAFFISIQGNQYRHAINARDKGASTKEGRVEESIQKCRDTAAWLWFMNPKVHPNDANDCFPKNDLLIKSGQRKNYCSFAGRNGVNYIYQYRKISPNATVGNILEIVVEDVKKLLEQLNNQQ